MAYLALVLDDVVVNKFEISDEALSIGRSKDNRVQIEDHAVSGFHAEISQKNDDFLDEETQFVISDLGSTNSTRVNGSKITQQRLYHNDLIEIGYNKFRFIDDTQVNLERTAVIVSDD